MLKMSLAAARQPPPGGAVGTVVGDILTARIPPQGLHALAAEPALERMEAGPLLVPLNDAVLRQTNADRIHRGSGNLERPYTGRGVIVGIIDTGIDFRHVDFRDPADSTRSRVLALWDQRTREQIESALRGETHTPLQTPTVTAPT